MNIEKRLEEMKRFQNFILDFLDNDDDEQSEENYKNICKLLSIHNFITNAKELELFMRVLQNIFRNHHRLQTFHEKFFRILVIFLKDLKQIYSNFAIFNIFKKDKRILLFLIEKGVLQIDQEVSNIITHVKNHQLISMTHIQEWIIINQLNQKIKKD